MKKPTFKGMRKAVSLMFNRMKMGNWTKKPAKYYLKTEAIDQNLSENCLAYRKNAYKYQHMLDKNRQNTSLLQLKEDHPKYFWNLNCLYFLTCQKKLTPQFLLMR